MNPDNADKQQDGVTRRALLEGLGAITATTAVGGAILPAQAAQPGSVAASTVADRDYPPVWRGLRGQNDAALNAAHAMRDGASFPEGDDTGEVYDLVVVGAGSSGLAAAYYYRKALPAAKILILDNCDDFGGHARRNEFVIRGKPVLGSGGAYTVMYPKTYTVSGKALLTDIGISADRYYAAVNEKQAQSRERNFVPSAFFDRETYGVDRLVPGYPGAYDRDPALGDSGAEWMAFLKNAPLSVAAKKDLLRLVTERRDYMPGLASDEKVRRLRKISYADYLTKVAMVHPDAVSFLRREPGYLFNVGASADSFSAWFAYQAQAGGFLGLGLPPVGYDNLFSDMIHFPDGNAGVVRLMVRWLIPEALPGSSMEDSVGRRVDYAKLDQAGAPVRLRLNSTVIRAAHIGQPDEAREVFVTYVRAGKIQKVRAATCVMACFNAMVPHLCPEIPEVQKAALHLAVRKPLLVASIGLRNWRAFDRLNTPLITSSNAFFQTTMLETGVSLGDYRRSHTPDDAAVVLLSQYPDSPGLTARDQYRAGRAEMLAIDEKTYEAKAVDQLQRMLAAGGFDTMRDIEGIMINRWGHGYSCGGNDLFDPDWKNEEAPWVQGRRRFGRIAIANSDAAGISMMQAAFDQADRAVGELIRDVIRPPFYRLNPERG